MFCQANIQDVLDRHAPIHSLSNSVHTEDVKIKSDFPNGLRSSTQMNTPIHKVLDCQKTVSNTLSNSKDFIDSRLTTLKSYARVSDWLSGGLEQNTEPFQEASGIIYAASDKK